MAVSDVSIANVALMRLGASQINTLTDNNERARVMNSLYEQLRRSELRKRRWRFSITRTSLAALSTAPDSDYARQFQLPNDYLRLLEGGDLIQVADLTDYRYFSNALYSVEGGKVLTSLGAPLHIRYIRDVTDTALWDVAFDEYFGCCLAVAACARITESTAKMADLMAERKTALIGARAANAMETASEHPTDSEWITARAW